MIQQKTIHYFSVLVLTILLISCSGEKKPQSETVAPQIKSTETIEINSEAQLLLKTLTEMGDYANSRNFPSLIKPSSVYEELVGNIHIVDLREEETFANGHIKGAVNVAFSDLPGYFSTEIKPFEYDKIILVCYAGQIASYSTAILRLAGYGNVYAMRWGMSGWNKEFATDSWLNVVSSEYENRLELTDNDKAEKNDFPQLNTGKTTGEEILDERINTLFAEGYSNALISAERVFETPENFYTINYDRRDKYEAGHIPGAIRYKPNGTLGIEDEMQTIPANREVVIYCNTGHNSGFVTAYLRLFGYDSKTLTYGTNAFMFNKMVEEEKTLSWKPFTESEIENYPYVK